MRPKREKKHLSKNMLGQLIYLTSTFYIQNNLYTCAASCAFGFLFSFIPIVMMVLAVLMPLLHSSRVFIDSVVAIAAEYENMFDVKSFINTLLSYTTFKWSDFLLVLFIIWMARKFFVTMMQGMNKIFHYKTKSRPIFNQVIVFAGELVLVIITTIVVLVFFVLRQLFTQPMFSSLRMHFPRFLGFVPNIFVNAIAYVLIFVLVTLAYRFTAQTKPKIKWCVACAAACTVIFFIVSKCMSIFLNVSNYNIIYGVLSTLVILLFEAYIFFTLFLVCAQVIYVIQFFDSLLLGELYLLPERDDTAVRSVIRRVLFITPVTLMNNDNVVSYTAGSVIYAKGEQSSTVYYVMSGTVIVSAHNNFSYYDKGSFFGEQSCIIDKPHIDEASALIDCEIMKISATDFRAFLDANPLAAEKALAHVAEYIAKVI
ncbi:MAG: YihY/virulence factor BrkB family protein [Treponema sp.]|nr:YihY/virulence factor BrkB family protein [Treponema sp.]